MAVVVIPILLCGVGLLVLGYCLHKSLETETDPSLYADIVAERLEWSEEYEFLPRIIPKDAVKVAFVHIPGFLQGPDEIVLRLTLPPERVQSVLKELEDSGRTEVSAADRKRYSPYYPGTYPLYDGEKRPLGNMDVGLISKLPDSVRLFLGEKSDKSFTAISSDTNEVFYSIGSK